MVVAASLALMTVSTVVAFQGWPGISTAHPTTEASTLALDAGETVAHRMTRPALVVPKRSAPAARATKDAQRTQTQGNAPTATTKAPTQATTKLKTRPSSQPTPAQKTTTVQSKAPAAIEPKAGDSVRKVGANIGGSVSTAGETLGNAVGNASPQLGEVVKTVSDVVATVVANATDALGQVLDGLTGARTP